MTDKPQATPEQRGDHELERAAIFWEALGVCWWCLKERCKCHD